MNLADLLRRAAAVGPVTLACWMIGNDRYARSVDHSERAKLAGIALADGADMARSTPSADPEALGASIAYADDEIAVAGHIFSADYRPGPPRIRLYTRAIAAIDRGLAQPGIAAIVGTAQSAPVLLAHELYHHLDLGRPASLTQRHRVTSLKLGPLHLRTELPSLAEIAAGRFAATLLGLHCHPKLLDLLLLWDSDPRRAEAWVSALGAFDANLARTETV